MESVFGSLNAAWESLINSETSLNPLRCSDALRMELISALGFARWGAVAQLGERLVRNEEVSGSIPLSSTKESITCGKGMASGDTFVSLFVS